MENNEQVFNNQQDLLIASFLFAKALTFILKEGQGLVLDVDEEAGLPIEYKKVIVFKMDDQIRLYKCDDDYVQGTVVNMTNPAE